MTERLDILRKSKGDRDYIRVKTETMDLNFRVKRKIENGSMVLAPADHTPGSTPPDICRKLACKGLYVGNAVGKAFAGP